MLNWLIPRFEVSRKQSNLRPMEGLRGLAVILVFFVHYHALSAPWIPSSSLTATIAYILHEIGYTGVDLFFVLSGFLITGLLLDARGRLGGLRRFWRRPRPLARRNFGSMRPRRGGSVG
jgi:peptidoglycan/LPS O-acetylase OafA/YrhL